MDEVLGLEPDKKFYEKRVGKVQNLVSRWHLCIADVSVQGDVEKQIGTIINFDQLSILKDIRETLPKMLGYKAEMNICEASYYNDVSKCGVGWHGDINRKIVIGLRLGASMQICFNWFQRTSPVGKKFEAVLNHGDLYIMSEKTTGNDYRDAKKLTLRHSAGAQKHSKVPPVKIQKNKNE